MFSLKTRTACAIRFLLPFIFVNRRLTLQKSFTAQPQDTLKMR